MAADSGQRAGASDPHGQQPILTAGPVVAAAEAVLVLLHGRGTTAQSMLSLYTQLDLPGVAVLAPQAAGYTWYPHSFLAPIETNQPFLDSALGRIESIVNGVLEQGVRHDKIAILGFSQGACLTCEFVARHPRRYGAVIAFTGGLIGAPGTLRNDPGSLDHTPIFLGTSDPDPHVPVERVQETAAVFKQMGGNVDLRFYPGMPHTINEEELEAARSLLQSVISRGQDQRP